MNTDTAPGDDLSGFAPQKPLQTYRRRTILKLLGGLGLGSVAFQRAVAAQASEEGKITAEMIQQAEWIAGLELSDDQRQAAADAVDRSLAGYDSLRKVTLDNHIPPALHFSPLVLPQRRTQPIAARSSHWKSLRPRDPRPTSNLRFCPSRNWPP